MFKIKNNENMYLANYLSQEYLEFMLADTDLSTVPHFEWTADKDNSLTYKYQSEAEEIASKCNGIVELQEVNMFDDFELFNQKDYDYILSYLKEMPEKYQKIYSEKFGEGFIGIFLLTINWGIPCKYDKGTIVIIRKQSCEHPFYEIYFQDRSILLEWNNITVMCRKIDYLKDGCGIYTIENTEDEDYFVGWIPRTKCKII